jgi:hypothetical protein
LVSTFNPELNLVSGPQVGQVFVTSTFPDLRNGNPITAEQNQAFYNVQSWRTVDSCAKITYRGPPLYGSGTAQVVRSSVTQERLTTAKVQGAGTGPFSSMDFLTGASQLYNMATGVTDAYPNQFAANPGFSASNSVIPYTQILGNLRLELSSNGPTNAAEICSMTGAESFPAMKTLYSKSILQDVNYQPWVDGAMAIVNIPAASAVGPEVPCWGQLIQGTETYNSQTVSSNAGVQLVTGPLPGYGHGDTTFFYYSGLSVGSAATQATLFIECEACFEGTLARRSTVGRLAQPAPPKDLPALEVVSDVQRKLPAASESGSWLSDAAEFYIGGMKKSIGFAYDIGGRAASAAGFKGVGDLGSAVANLLLNDTLPNRRRALKDM